LIERNFYIGVVQMSCTPEPEQNLERAVEQVRAAAGKGAEIICLPELFQTQYFCQREDVALFDLAEPIPGPATKRLGDLARELKVTIIASLFERRAPVFTTIPPLSLIRAARSQASTARCTFPTTRSITRSFTSRRATWGLRVSKLISESSARWSAGTSGIPRARG